MRSNNLLRHTSLHSGECGAIVATATTQSSKKRGVVYCFVNESMPNIFKIGMTNCIDRRLKEANTSDTWKPPTPYTVLCYVKVDDMYTMERIAHAYFSRIGRRIHPRREFFTGITIEQIMHAVEIAKIYIPPILPLTVKVLDTCGFFMGNTHVTAHHTNKRLSVLRL